MDDKLFTYYEDFKADGYHIEHWFLVNSLADLEGYRDDIVILDIRGIARHLNDEDGLGVARHLREQQPSLPIVLYSSDTYNIAVDRTSADEVFDVVHGDYQQFRRLIDGIYSRITDPDFFLRNLREPTAGREFTEKDRKVLRSAVRRTLADPSDASEVVQLSHHDTTIRGAEILRHAKQVAKRLHGQE